MKKFWLLTNIILVLVFSCKQGSRHPSPPTENQHGDTVTALAITAINDTLTIRSKTDTTITTPHLSNQHSPPDKETLYSIKKGKTKEKKTFPNYEHNNH